jgi:hypothetical protein
MRGSLAWLLFGTDAGLLGEKLPPLHCSTDDDIRGDVFYPSRQLVSFEYFAILLDSRFSMDLGFSSLPDAPLVSAYAQVFDMRKINDLNSPISRADG